MTGKRKTGFIAWMGIVIFMAFLCCCGAGAEETGPIRMMVSYMDPSGQEIYCEAQWLGSAGYEDAWWAYLPAEADMNALILHVEDELQLFGSFWPGNGDVLSGVQNCGSSAENGNDIQITAFPADGSEPVLFRLFISKDAPMPVNMDEPVPMQSMQVILHYTDETGTLLAQDSIQEVWEGENIVYAQPMDLPDGYVTEYDTVTLTANAAEYLMPYEISFVYTYVPAVQWPKQVRVRYTDENGMNVASDTFADVFEGENDVAAAPFDLAEGYVNPGEEVTLVSVDSEGNCYPDTITFVYTKVEEAIWPVEIPVRYLDAETHLPVASETICAIFEGENRVRPTPYDLQEGYVPAEGNSETVVIADASGKTGMDAVTFLYVYDPAYQEQDSGIWYVTIHYIDEENGNPIAEDTIAEIRTGENVITAPDTLQEVYHPTEYSTMVYADENGVLSVDGEITFVYYREEIESENIPGEVIIVPQNVTVYYLSTEGVNVAPSATVTCTAGENLILCEPSELKENYEPVDMTPFTVYVDENGASSLEVTFWFRQVVTPEPATEAPETPSPVAEPDPTPEPEIEIVTPEPSPVYVRVRYVNLDDGAEFANEYLLCAAGAVTPIYANLALVSEKLNGGYELRGDTVINVTVTADGVTAPDNVTFYVSAKTAYVTVYYRDEMGNDIADPMQIECPEGNTPVSAEPTDLLPGYELDLSRSAQIVNVYQQDGIVTPNTVEFFYKRMREATPVPEVDHPMDAMDTYARPKADIYVRSAPTAEEDNRAFTVSPADVLHVTGKIVNDRNESWYRIDNDGVVGYVKDNAVSMMTDDQIRDYLNGTPTPVPVTASPEPSATPEYGNAINLWGKTTAGSVNIRDGAGTNYKSRGKLDRNTKVWVLEAEPDMDGKRWYHVMYRSKEYYVSADYVTLLSREESEAIQAGLNTPAPEKQAATAMPTMMPTFTPVPTVYIPVTAVPETPAPTEEPVFVPYNGYAAVILDTSLWNAPDFLNGYTVYAAEFDTLLLVRDQVKDTDGRIWDDVAVAGKEAEGYIPDDEVRHVNDQEAYDYIRALPVQTTVPPVIVTPVPEPYAGYFCTLGTVPLRAAPDGQAMITTMLYEGSVCYVLEQEYTEGETWDLVQCADMYGFVRGDQLREMDPDETVAYLDSFRTATPEIIMVTPAPVTEEDDSCFGYVNTGSGKVNLRSEPNTDSLRLGLYSQYTLCTVIGSTYDEEGKMWYRVLIGEREGYIRSDYLTVLKQNEVTAFRNSQEYRSAVASGSSEGIYQEYADSIEDRNLATWNPETVTTWMTATPEATLLPTVTPTMTPYVYVDPTLTPGPVLAPISQNQTAAPDAEHKQESGSGALVWIIVLVLVAGGAGIYAYTIHLRNERRRARVREQQARRTVREERNMYASSAARNPQAAQQGAFSRDGNSDAPYYMRAGGNANSVRPAVKAGAGIKTDTLTAVGTANSRDASYRRPEGGTDSTKKPQTSVYVHSNTNAYSSDPVVNAKARTGEDLSATRVIRTAGVQNETVEKEAYARPQVHTAPPVSAVSSSYAGMKEGESRSSVSQAEPLNGFTEPVRRRRSERHNEQNG